jgi:hypothetical protein
MFDVILVQNRPLPGDYAEKVESALRLKNSESAAAGLCEIIEQLEYALPEDADFWHAACAVALSPTDEKVASALRSRMRTELDENYRILPERSRLFYRIME